VGFTGKKVLPSGKVLLHPKITKTALGAEKDLNISFLKDAQELISFAQQDSLELIAIEQHTDSTPLKTWEPQRNVILVFGNEVDGITKEILEKSDQIVEITRLGNHNSLNVTTACGIVLHYYSGALVSK